MKELTEEEFTDRMMAIQRASAIFIDSGLTNNITIAFRTYQAIFAEREREIFISTMMRRTISSGFDKYERVKCPDCGADMMFRQIPENEQRIKTQLVCSKCDAVLNSENDLNWWMENLTLKAVNK